MPDPTEVEETTLQDDAERVSEATHRHLDEVIRPSLLPHATVSDDASSNEIIEEEDDFPSTGHPSHP